MAFKFYSAVAVIVLVFQAPLAAANRLFDPVSSVDSLQAEMLNWQHRDPQLDQIAGTSVERAWKELLPLKKAAQTVVVAIIDSGVDIDHEDLEGTIWVNEDEIPGNGIDDDNNGYIDDIHGWNFLGTRDGKNIEFENYEYARIVRKYKDEFGHVANEAELPEDLRDDYRLYRRSLKKFTSEWERLEAERMSLQIFEERLAYAESKIAESLGKKDYTLSELMKLNSTDEEVNNARFFLLSIYQRGFSKDALAELKEYVDANLNKRLNLSYNPRALINDDPEDITDRNYGNNDVKGPNPSHGTFVAGIIAARRDNNIGIDGIADNVKLMILRAVPDGDEYDKDVALAIRYAVDNGANIINMSFGKNFSPQKEFVDEAIRYAVENNVLIVHAAGNDAVNIDKHIHYPTPRLGSKEKAASVITVGAATMYLDRRLPGDFSNYGREHVDLFAPGVDMISLYPGNKYNLGSGTSFSSPVVAGIAALVWSRHPELTALQLKELLLETAQKYSNQKVYLPAESEKRKTVRFKKLSNTGGLINAWEALKKAEFIASAE